MSRVIDVGLPMEIVECPTCGMTHGIPEKFVKERRQDGKDFWCPAGHAIVFKDGENAKLRKDLAAARAECNRERLMRERAEGSLRSTRGVVTKLRNKAQGPGSGEGRRA